MQIQFGDVPTRNRRSHVEKEVYQPSIDSSEEIEHELDKNSVQTHSQIQNDPSQTTNGEKESTPIQSNKKRTLLRQVLYMPRKQSQYQKAQLNNMIDAKKMNRNLKRARKSDKSFSKILRQNKKQTSSSEFENLSCNSSTIGFEERTTKDVENSYEIKKPNFDQGSWKYKSRINRSFSTRRDRSQYHNDILEMSLGQANPHDVSWDSRNSRKRKKIGKFQNRENSDLDLERSVEHAGEQLRADRKLKLQKLGFNKQIILKKLNENYAKKHIKMKAELDDIEQIELRKRDRAKSKLKQRTYRFSKDSGGPQKLVKLDSKTFKILMSQLQDLLDRMPPDLKENYTDNNNGDAIAAQINIDKLTEEMKEIDREYNLTFEDFENRKIHLCEKYKLIVKDFMIKTESMFITKDLINKDRLVESGSLIWISSQKNIDFLRDSLETLEENRDNMLQLYRIYLTLLDIPFFRPMRLEQTVQVFSKGVIRWKDRNTQELFFSRRKIYILLRGKVKIGRRQPIGHELSESQKSDANHKDEEKAYNKFEFELLDGDCITPFIFNLDGVNDHQEPSMLTIKYLEPCCMLEIEINDNIKEILEEYKLEDFYMRIKFLKGHRAFKDITFSALINLAKPMYILTRRNNRPLFRVGKVPKGLHLVISGKINVNLDFIFRHFFSLEKRKKRI